MTKTIQFLLIFLIAGIISCQKSNAQISQNAKDNAGFHQVKARTNADSPNWNSYKAKTIDMLQGF